MEPTREKETPINQTATILVRAEATAGRLALVETIERHHAEPPCHRHHWEDKLLYVLDGELAFFLGGDWQIVPAGQAVFVPRGVEHTFTVLSDTARLLVIFTPAGFESFYQDIHENLALDKHKTSVERWVTAAARYGCEVTGPHPGRPV